jgi:hypothetical protein
MQEIIGPTPTDRDQEIYEAWQGGKSPRTLARELRVSMLEIELSIDRCLPPFTSAAALRAFKREFQRLDDVSAYYYTKAMQGDHDSAHVVARVSERKSSMAGWNSVSVKLDAVAAQAAERPSQHERIKNAIMTLARGPNWRQLVDERLNDLPESGNGKDAPPTAPDSENPD